jgi:hypothetical protein
MSCDWIAATTSRSERHDGLQPQDHARVGRRGYRRRVRPLAVLTAALAGVFAAAPLRADVSIAAIPAPSPPTVTGVGNWANWAVLSDAGPTVLSPSLAANAGGLELATVGLDLGVAHSRFANGAWSPALPTGRLTFLPPVIVADASGTPQLLVTAPDAAVQHSRFQSNVWSNALPTRASSFLPPAAAINSTGNTLEVVTVDMTGGLQHSRFAGNAWTDPSPLDAVTFLPPTLASNPAGGVELAVIGPDRQVYHARFAGSQWSDFRATGVFTDMAPALTVTPDGVVHLAATGLDRNVVHSRFVNNAWTAPVPTGIQSALSPVLGFNAGGNALELLARGLDRVVQHGRFVGGAWAAPVPLGITTDVRPALAVAATVDAAVVGTDGRVYASRFTAATTPAPAAVSFSKDITTRIFRNYGCNGCHGGSGGLTLGAQAFNNIVNKPSVGRPNFVRIKPGDPTNSYLLMKILADSRITGARMPLGGAAVKAADVELLRQWIAAGAPNN